MNSKVRAQLHDALACPCLLVGFLSLLVLLAPDALAAPAISPGLTKPLPITVAELAQKEVRGVSVFEVSDYVFGNYRGDFPSPPHADLNPKKAFIIVWQKFPYRFVFCHEGSYCPWFELPSGAGVCYQFFEGNDGWAELFNNWGRLERNSFVNIIEAGPDRVWVRWTYFGVNMEAGEPAYHATEDFWAYPNGLVLRRQTYESLRPKDHHGYAREPIELIGLCPAGKLWSDVLLREGESGERHALAVLDAFSDKRYDIFWKPKPGTLWDSTHRKSGCEWRMLDDSPGVVMAIPMADGTPFCAFGDASGYRHDYTRLKDHTFVAEVWGSSCWDHWPIGWLNSQGHPVDKDSLRLYPNHFSPLGMDFFALPNEEVARGNFYSLYGVAGDDLEAPRKAVRQWLEKGEAAMADPACGADLPVVYAPRLIQKQPQGAVLKSGQTARFSVIATRGLSPRFQWQRAKPGAAEFEDLAGADAGEYATGALSAEDNGARYRCLLTIPGTTVTSSVATVTVDAVPPRIISVRTLGKANRVTVVFSEPIALPVEPSDFAIDNGVTVTGISAGARPGQLELASTPIRPEHTYTLTAHGILDRVGNEILPNSSSRIDLTVELPAELGQTVNGFQDDFDSETIDAHWKAVPASPLSYAQTNGALCVSVKDNDPNHLLYVNPDYLASDQEVLARVRVTAFESGASARAGVALCVHPQTSLGINLAFRDFNGRQFKLLDDHRAWVPPDPATGLALEFADRTWYWLRLAETRMAGTDNMRVRAKAWLADGSTAEPKNWSLDWSCPARPGFAGILGSSDGAIANFEVDYILIKAAGLPLIRVTPGAFNLSDNRGNRSFVAQHR
ncbi:MAG: hypothetical protein M1608_08975 [Candidatus Omnitrophica bacterium]|nr:hypothetical protein [Candidatus Omnitrophota bacterium]